MYVLLGLKPLSCRETNELVGTTVKWGFKYSFTKVNRSLSFYGKRTEIVRVSNDEIG